MDRHFSQATETVSYFYLFEKFFSVLTLVFYSSSIFFLPQYDFAFLGVIERLIYHSTTLMVLILLVIRWRELAIVFKRSLPLLSVVLFVMISIFWSDFPEQSMPKNLDLFRSTAFGLYLGTRYNLKEYLSVLALSYIVSVLLSFIYCLVWPQYGVMGMGLTLSPEDTKHWGAWRGIYGHKNYMGKSMVLGALCFLLLDNNSQQRTYKYLSISLISLSLWLSNSKTSLIIFATLFFLIPLFQSMRLKYTRMLPILSSVILAIGSGALLIADSYEQILGLFGRDATLSGRTDLWHQTWLSISDRPLLGYGYGAFWVEGGGAEIIWHELRGYQAPHAHNGLLDLWLEIGVMGTSIFVALYIVTFIQSLFVLRNTTSLSGIFPIAFLVLMFMTNLTESSTLIRPNFAWTIFTSIVLLVKKEMATTRTESNAQDKKKQLETAL